MKAESWLHATVGSTAGRIPQHIGKTALW